MVNSLVAVTEGHNGKGGVVLRLHNVLGGFSEIFLQSLAVASISS